MGNDHHPTRPPALPDEPSIYPYVAQAMLPARAALVFAPHPDDEVFGCGGLIAAWLDAEVRVQVVLVSDGAQGGDGPTRELESTAAARALAAGRAASPSLSFWRLPDREVRADDALVQRMAKLIAGSGADVVLAPSPYEIHPDHRAVCSAATAAFASTFSDDSAALLAYYEVGHPLLPNRLIDITPVLARKQAAIGCFASQLAQQDYGEQVLALNRFRSYTLGTRVTHAEAYRVLGAADVRDGLAAVIARDADAVRWRLGLDAAGQAMDRGRFKAMWEQMQGDGYFENSAQYEGSLNPLQPRAATPLDALLESLAFTADSIHLPVPYSKALEASVLHTERHWLPRMFELPGAGVAVDLGCGYGRSVAWLKDRFHAVIGLDISESVLEAARRTFADAPGVSFLPVSGDGLPAAIEADSVDFIYAFTVFQHIPRNFTARYLKDARRRLRADGLIVFNLLSGMNENVEGGEYGTEWSIGYSEEAARRLVSDSGLRLVRLIRWTADGAPGHWLWIGASRE